MANYAFNPRTPATMIEPPFESKQGADGMLDKLLAIHQLIADQLKVAKAIQKHHADKRTKPMEYSLGDKVMLSTQNLKLLNQPSKKFRSRFTGPYEITKKISSQAYQLKLPGSMKVHPVFHVSLLKPYFSAHPDADVPMTYLLPMITFMAMTFITFMILWIIKSPLALQNIPRAVPYSSELGGKVLVLRMIPGNPMSILKRLTLFESTFVAATNFDCFSHPLSSDFLVRNTPLDFLVLSCSKLLQYDGEECKDTALP